MNAERALVAVEWSEGGAVKGKEVRPAPRGRVRFFLKKTQKWSRLCLSRLLPRWVCPQVG